jgi:hypothetical protein
MSTRVTIRIFAATCFCAASVVGQQTPGHAAAPALAKVSTQAPAQKWHTPWGDPDLQGTWTNATTTPLERPAKYMGREFLTKEERAAQDKVTEVATDKRCRGRLQRRLVGSRAQRRAHVPDLRSARWSHSAADRRSEEADRGNAPSGHRLGGSAGNGRLRGTGIGGFVSSLHHSRAAAEGPYWLRQ